MNTLGATIQPMTEGEHKERLRSCSHVAIRYHRRYDIADAIGCSRQTFSTFMSGGPLGATYRSNLEAWLREKGYWQDSEIQPDSSATVAQRILAGELRNLADLMEADMSDKFKAERFVSFVTQYAKGYEAELNRRKE